MAYAPHRSAIEELNQGMSEGTYKQAHPNRGGVVEGATCAARKDLDPTFYGQMREATLQQLPDGLSWADKDAC